jgi:hypothetical protein
MWLFHLFEASCPSSCDVNAANRRKFSSVATGAQGHDGSSNSHVDHAVYRLLPSFAVDGSLEDDRAETLLKPCRWPVLFLPRHSMVVGPAMLMLPSHRASALDLTLTLPVFLLISLVAIPSHRSQIFQPSVWPTPKLRHDPEVGSFLYRP